MKNLKILFSLFIAVLFIVSCQEKDPELGTLPDKSEIAFSVAQDLTIDAGGNTVIMKNLTPGVVAMWDYGTGRSNRDVDTVHYAFKGTYVVYFSALTAAGIVECDSTIITVTQDNLMYVNDPLWNALSGGVGNEKVWVMDLDANGVSKYFTSPLYFYGTNMGWGGTCMLEGADCWNWNPEWKGNQWIMPQGDYGTMTFNLKGGPFVKVEHKVVSSRGTENGTYFLDVNTKTLTLTDATPLHDQSRDACVGAWGNIRLLSLSENYMQFAVLRTACEGPCLLVYNYISKDFSDQWQPPAPKGDPNFDFGNQQELLAFSASKTWKFDLQVPYNWTNLEGGFLNNWNSRADIIATGWAPYGNNDTANIMNVTIKFGADKSVVITQNDGTKQTGTFEINETKNLITFSNITPNIPIASWVSVTTTDKNQWKIVKVEKDALTDEVIGIWFGKRDPVKSEYMVFHFRPK